jgi:hypothetical protein
MGMGETPIFRAGVKRDFARAAMRVMAFHGQACFAWPFGWGKEMSEEKPRSRFGTGFLWGCLAPLILIGALVAVAVIYAVYYLTLGYKNDDTLQAVLTALRHNPTAHMVLGDNIDITGMPTYSFRYDTQGHTASYAFGVRGSRGQGSVTTNVIIWGGHADIKTLTLTGPDGHVYNLIGSSAPTNSVWLHRWAIPHRIESQPA